ncbi:lysozyme [Candidatus Sodalis endolongispinus]|uniref:Lysozyme n=1 Tax=Candidatus Sodalis endolongispinus TaxID=2812662 RepID=A0ABS5Y7Z1_9GAMM|nr:lysozyme [Candidatus Sodalis endolongispinus]MBT9431058.1 lysozyme [Candidatus Sodalis endolongispinus]
MNISQNGVARIKAFEGLKLTAYQCSADKWTIGYGHTNGVKAEEVITLEQADAFLRDDIDAVVERLNALITVPVSQNQFDALCSLAFNIGIEAFATSTLLKKLNEGDYPGAAAEFPKWCRATVKGKKESLSGLIERRQEEKALFESRE